MEKLVPKNNINKRMQNYHTVLSSVIQLFVCLTLLIMPTVRAEAHDGNDHEYLPEPTISVKNATAFSPNNDGVQDEISVFYTIPDQRTIEEAIANAGNEAQVAIAARYIVESALRFEQNGQSVGTRQTNVREGSGQHVYVWDGEDGSNEELPDGTYKLKLSVTYRHFEDVVPQAGRLKELPAKDLENNDFETVDNNADNEDAVEDWRVRDKRTEIRHKAEQVVDIDRDGDEELLVEVEDGKVTYRELGDIGGFNEHTHVKFSDATTDIIIDRYPPNVARVQGNGNVTLVDGGYIAGTLTTITVTADKGSGTDIDFTANETAISLTAEDGTVLSGATTLQGTTLTLTLGNPLDTRGENGTYTLSYTIVDKAGNAAEGTTTFTYDTVAPTLVSVATSNGKIPPSRGVRGEVKFVEATFIDNLEDGFSRGSSTILLNAPDALPVLGRQLSPEKDKIRLEFLTPLVAGNGERDGTYTIVIDAVDRAGNRTETQVPFIYDNRAPQLVTLSASEDGEAFSGIQNRLYHSAPLYQIVATFSDGDTGTGVDVEKGTTTITFHPVGETPPPEPNIIPDRDNNRVALLLEQPLISRDGSQDGIYTLKVTVADRLGNTETKDFQLIYDTQIPTLVSTVPAANETVSSLTQVQVNLKEATSGIDFVQSTFRLTHNDTEVPINVTSNGTENATLTVLAPFAIDGSDDGTYVIEVTPHDRAGNQGAAARREFFLVTQTGPKIRLLRPETSTVNRLTAGAEGLVAVELVDYIGVGIDFDASTLVVKSPDGVPIPRNIAPAPPDKENRRLLWNTESVLPDDGSADGEYTITATFVDFNGRRWTEDFTFNVDTQFPKITDVQALTETPTDMGAERIPVIAEAFSRITVGFEEDDIDIGNTAVVLTGPGESDIAINVTAATGTGAATVNINFSKLLASGDYRLSITPQDYVGNVSARPFVYRFRLDVDTQLPAITSVVALTTPLTEIDTERIPVIAEGFSGITVTFEETAGDAAPTPLDIDISNTAVSLTGPDDTDIAINVTHEGKSSLTLNFSRLTASGNYSLSVTPQDYAGNVSPRPFVYPFRLDVALPKVSAVEIGGKIGTVVYVNDSATSIVATFTAPTGTGLAFGNEGSRISVTNADGTEIPGVTTAQGTNQLVWQAIGQPTDGTADGRYTVTVTPVDKAGRQGEVARRQFIYDTQAPQLTAASLVSLTAPVTYVTAGFASDTEFSFTVADVGPAGVEMSEQTAQLLGADGTALSAVVTRNQTDRLFLTLTEPLAVDGSADGSYAVTVSLVDKAGNETQAEYAVVYDTQVPAVSSVTLNTAEPTVLVATQPTVISELGFSQLDIVFEEATTRVDFANTTVTLTGPDNETLPPTLPLTLTPKGTTQLTAAFVAPQALGVYTLSITPQDIAGNVASGAVNYRFRLDVEVPRVTSVTIDGQVGGVVYINGVNGAATRIVAKLADPSGAGLALGEGGSTITVANAGGTSVPGTTTDNGEDELTWVPGVLPLDGTADGRYTVTITPRDKAGRQGAAVYRQFVFDTQPPQVTEAVPITLNQPHTYLNASFAQNPQVQFTVADVGPAALDLAEQRVLFRAPDGNEMPAAMKHNEADQVFLTLTEPLPIDGSADGPYAVTLTLVDRAGNETKAEYAVVYDTQVPTVAGVTLNTAEPTVLVATQPTVISELGFSQVDIAFEEATTRVDFANTTVTLTGPDNETLPPTLPLTLTPKGTTHLTAAFVAPQALGVYTLSITPRDIAGNVASGAVTYRFRLDVEVPRVTSVTIDGQVGGVVYINGVNGAAPRIVAKLADPSGAGLALGEGGSTITVANAGGTPVPGTTTDNGEDALTWVPGVLPLDGTADGRYTVTITPRDKAGRQGAAVYRQFVFDTQPPQVTEAVPITLNQPRTYLNASFAQHPQVQFTVADVGPAALDLAEQRVHFRAPDGTEMPAAMKHNAADQVFLTLTEPLPIDGSADGPYAVTLTLVDRAGNETKAEYAVVYDTQVPTVAGVTLNTAEPTVLVATQPTVISELGFSQVDIAFEEATTRVDFANTTVTVTGPDNEPLSLTLTPVTVEREPAASEPQPTVLSAQFVAPQALGIYTLSITPQDIAGNTARGAVTYRFRLDIDLPSVSAVVIDGKAGGIVYVNGAAMRIVATLTDPSGAGLALGEGGSTITVANAGGTPVPGTTTDNGEDELTWMPSALPLDGTADGRYTVTITPRDKAGRQGAAVYRQFVFDTQPPEVTAASPMDLSQPVTYLSAPSALAQMSVTVADVGPAEFWVEEQVMTLADAAGNTVPANLTHNETDRIFLTLPQPLAKDGSEDGEYTVQVTLVDKSGNRYAAEHSIVYDTQAPHLVSTVPADGDILTDDVSQVQATLKDAGGSGIDFAATTLTLVAPGGTSITGALSNDGESELTLNLNPLVEDGRYRIRVEARDRAGNGDELRFERSFLLSRTLPSVVTTQPVTAPAEDAFTNEKISQIEVELESADAKTDEKHLSTLRLLGPGASVIPGQQQREASRLTYTLARPLAQDGSEDGIYTIEFTPISPSGRSGDVQRLTFTYDTEAPELESEDIQLVVSESGVNNSLTEIRVKLTDNQSGIDWENLDDDWLSFERISPNAPNGETISGKVEDAEQDTLRFRLTSPLADDGSNDGQYRITVSPKDRAGNTSEPYEKAFTYDTAPPVIDDSTLLINDAPLLVDANALDYPTPISTTGGVVIQANMFDDGLGVNLAKSRIVVRTPDGAQLAGTTQQNGVDTLVFKSAGLNTRGLYQVTVTSVGNDSEFLGFAPQDSITTEFLYETTVPTATLTSDGGEKELTDKALPLEGTATDPGGTQRIGDREQQVPASGVWLVEIVGTGPDEQPIEPVPAVDDSNAEEEPWSRWSLDFLPSRSGEYELDVRVTDNAGNYDVYDIGKYTMSVSLTFRGSTFGWPNPLRISKGDVAFFSFDVNVPMGDTVELTLSIYDWSGDMVLSQTYPDVVSGIRNDQLLKWDLRNQAGNPVARGIYIFRLEAVNATGNRANVVGKVLVVD